MFSFHFRDPTFSSLGELDTIEKLWIIFAGYLGWNYSQGLCSCLFKSCDWGGRSYKHCGGCLWLRLPRSQDLNEKLHSPIKLNTEHTGPKSQGQIYWAQWLAKQPRWPMSGVTISSVPNTNKTRDCMMMFLKSLPNFHVLSHRDTPVTCQAL